MVPFFNKIIHLDVIDSTNSFLKENDFEDKTIVYTYNQTKGRGRQDRVWLSFENKNLALSILFKPETNCNSTVWYIATVSIALVNILSEYGIKNAWIKWPNDIYIENKKISGILAESIWEKGKQEKLIIGIGININSDENDLSIIDKKATSLFVEIKNCVNPDEFIDKFINELSKQFNIFMGENGVDFIKEKWLSYSHIVGKKVEWVFNNEKFYGEVINIEHDGYLIININNELRKIITGDINLLNY